MKRSKNSGKRRSFQERLLGVLRARYEEVLLRAMSKPHREVSLRNTHDLTVLFKTFRSTPENLVAQGGTQMDTPFFITTEEFIHEVNKVVRSSIARDFTPAIKSWKVLERPKKGGIPEGIPSEEKAIWLDFEVTSRIMDREFASIIPAGDTETTLEVKASVEAHNQKYNLGKYWSRRKEGYHV